MNKKWLQKSACILLTVCMVQVCTSCNKTKNTSSTNVKIAGGFKIYRLESDRVMEDSLWKFRVIYPNIVIDDNVIKDSTEFSDKMNTELMAGEGPDVIKADASIFNSFHKTMNSGIFYDISSFMENDNDFIPSSYNKTILDSGIVDGKQLYIPISYKVPCIWTAKSIWNETGVSFNKAEWTWQQLLDTGKNFIKNSQSGEKRYIFSDLYSAYESLKKDFDYYEKSHYDAFHGLLLSGGMEFVDYEKKQSHFNSPPFIALLETLKELNTHSTPNEVLKSYKKNFYGQLEEKSLLAVCDDTGDTLRPSVLSSNNSFIRNYLNNEMILYPFPTYSEGDKVMAEPLSIAAVNSNSKNKEAGYHFIRILLSLDIQEEINMGIPVSNIAIDEMMATNYGILLENNTKDQLPAELAEQAKEIMKNIDGCEIMDQGVLTFVQESVDSFIKGDITAKQAAEMIDNKVMLFLSE